MVVEESKDPLRGMDWKAVGVDLQKDPSATTKQLIKKRLLKKIREIPDYYFLPKMPRSSAFAIYGACIAGGIGAGMLLEIYINKKVKGVLGGYVMWYRPLYNAARYILLAWES